MTGYLAALLLLASVDAAAAPPLTALRDPFERPATIATPASLRAESELVPPAPPPPLRLRALILNGAHSLANIDGDVVAVGQRMDGYSVLRIDARGALVVRAGKRELLTMQEHPPRQEPTQDRNPE